MPRHTTKRRNFTPEQNAAIVRRHMVDKVAVSDLCDEYKIQPSVFYAILQNPGKRANRRLCSDHIALTLI